MTRLPDRPLANSHSNEKGKDSVAKNCQWRLQNIRKETEKKLQKNIEKDINPGQTAQIQPWKPISFWVSIVACLNGLFFCHSMLVTIFVYCFETMATLKHIRLNCAILFNTKISWPLNKRSSLLTWWKRTHQLYLLYFRLREVGRSEGRSSLSPKQKNICQPQI